APGRHTAPAGRAHSRPDAIVRSLPEYRAAPLIGLQIRGYGREMQATMSLPESPDRFLGLGCRRRRRRGGHGHRGAARRDLQDQLEQEGQGQGSDAETEHHAQENDQEEQEHVHKSAIPPARKWGWRFPPPPSSRLPKRAR